MRDSEGQKRAFTMEIENLGAGNIVTVELDSSSTWTLQFQIQPETVGMPLSLNSLSLSDSDLVITAGSSPVNATLIVTVNLPDVMTAHPATIPAATSGLKSARARPST